MWLLTYQKMFRYTPTIMVYDMGLGQSKLSDEVLQKGRDLRILLITLGFRRCPLELQQFTKKLLEKALEESITLDEEERKNFLKEASKDDMIHKIMGMLRLPFTLGGMDLVIPKLFISGIAAARNREMLKERGITHICMCIDGDPPFPEDFEYFCIKVLDVNEADIKSKFKEAIEFISSGRQRPDGKVLVHCAAGISRSATMVIAYLMHLLGTTADQSLALLRAARPIVSPNRGFASQLIDFECELFESQLLGTGGNLSM